MIKLTIQSLGLEETLNTLKGLMGVSEASLAYVTARTLTKCAQAGQAAVIKEMSQVFDRPTPWTLGSTYIKPARVDDLEARVAIKDQTVKGVPPTVWLRPQIYGGERDLKTLEDNYRRGHILPPDAWMVPGPGAILDAYGNMSRGQIQQITSALGVQPWAGYDQARTAKSIKRHKGIVDDYFVATRDNPTTRALKPGIYQHLPSGKIVQVWRFVSAPLYNVRLKFDEIVEEAAREHFVDEFVNAADSLRP